jgi:hypothetical protein
VQGGWERTRFGVQPAGHAARRGCQHWRRGRLGRDLAGPWAAPGARRGAMQRGQRPLWRPRIDGDVPGVNAGLGRSERQGNTAPTGGPSGVPGRTARGARRGGLRGGLGTDGLGMRADPDAEARGRGAARAAVRTTRRGVALRRQKSFSVPLFELIFLQIFV